jgi:tRNA(Arg) A34 adenosine deaminase TadA
MKVDEQFMSTAIQEAAKAPWPFGSVIVIDGKLISQAGSGDGEENGIDPTAHAEVNAVRFACKALKSADLKDAIIYTTCEPCAMCMGAIWYAGIRKVVYGSSIVDEELLFGWKELPLPAEVLQAITNGELSVQSGFMREQVMDMYRAHPLFKK